MVTPSADFLAAIVLGALAFTLGVDWYRRRTSRSKLVRRLRELSTSPGSRRGLPQQLLRRPEDAGAAWLARIVRFTPLRDMDHLLEQAGLPWKKSTPARAGLAIGVVLALGTLALVDSPLAVAAAFFAGLFSPRLYVQRRKSKRLRAFEEQLPDAIDLLGRSIRAGHGVSTGLRTVAEETEDPIAGEFRRVFEEQKYGLPFEDSMLGLTRRIDLIDLRVMVMAILIQREVGGNLAEILDKISRLIRTRFTMRRQLRVHTAQGRLSGYVLTLLPVVVGLMLALLDPQYLGTLLHDPVGRTILGSALVLQTLGYLWIWRILKLDI